MAGGTGDGEGRRDASALDREVDALRSRLDRVESVLAIQTLKARYAELVDRRHRSGSVVDDTELAEAAQSAAALFTEDAVWDGGPALGRVAGRPAIAARLRNTTLLFGRHFFVSPQITIDHDPDRARGRWELLSPCRDADGREFWMSGVEDDEYERADGVWLHSSMRMTTVLVAPVDGGWTIR